MEPLWIDVDGEPARLRFSHHATSRLRERFGGRNPTDPAAIADGHFVAWPPSWVASREAEGWLMGAGWAIPLARIADGWLALTVLVEE